MSTKYIEPVYYTEITQPLPNNSIPINGIYMVIKLSRGVCGIKML